MFTEEIINNLDDDTYIEVNKDASFDVFIVTVRNRKQRLNERRVYPIQVVLDPLIGKFIEREIIQMIKDVKKEETDS